MGLPTYAKKVTVLQDNDQGMILVLVDEKPVYEGNVWDFNLGIWINIMQNAGITVEEKEYDYED